MISRIYAALRHRLVTGMDYFKGSNHLSDSAVTTFAREAVVGLRSTSTHSLVRSNVPSAAHFGRVERATPR